MASRPPLSSFFTRPPLSSFFTQPDPLEDEEERRRKEEARRLREERERELREMGALPTAEAADTERTGSDTLRRAGAAVLSNLSAPLDLAELAVRHWPANPALP